MFFFVHIHPFPISFSTVNPPCVGVYKTFLEKAIGRSKRPGQPRLCDFFRALYHPGSSKNRGRLTSFGPQQLYSAKTTHESDLNKYIYITYATGLIIPFVPIKGHHCLAFVGGKIVI